MYNFELEHIICQFTENKNQIYYLLIFSLANVILIKVSSVLNLLDSHFIYEILPNYGDLSEK